MKFSSNSTSKLKPLRIKTDILDGSSRLGYPKSNSLSKINIGEMN